MRPRFADDAKHWRDRAAAMRVLAAELKEPDVMALMFGLADDYDNSPTVLRIARTSSGGRFYFCAFGSGLDTQRALSDERLVGG